MAVWQRVMCGGCLCAAVRYEARRLPREVYYCPCEVCRRAFGNVVAVWARFAAGSFHIVRGENSFYRSSDVAQRRFCRSFGAQLVVMGFETDEPVTVALGSLNRPQDLRPEGHFGVESNVPWFKVLDDLPHTRTEDIPDFDPPKRL